VGNEKILVGDIMNCQDDRDASPSFQVGVEDMRLSKSIMNSEVSSYHQRLLTEEEDQRHFLIIGGINIFLPRNQVEASAHAQGTVEYRHPTKNFMKEE
jgi:hypothetical protein